MNLSRHVLYQLLEFDRTGGNKQLGWAVERSVVWMTHLEAWVATVVPCLAVRETRHRDRQKPYAVTYGAFLHFNVEQLTGNMRALAKYWKHGGLVATNTGRSSKLI